MHHSGKGDLSIQGVELLVKTRCLQCLGWSGLAGAPWLGTMLSTTQRNSENSHLVSCFTDSSLSLPQCNGGGVIHGNSSLRPNWQVFPLGR